MNPATQSGSPRRGLHPLVASAAVSIIILSAVAVAAMLGWLPSISANPQAESAQSGPEAANLAPAPPAPGAPAPAQAQAQIQAQTQGAPAARAPAQAACGTCGVVESVREVRVPAQDNGDHLIGTIAGGVAGGVVGNQFGGGHGKTALTVLGAVGGALAGREVERNIRQQQTVTHYELTVRMGDGSKRQFRSAQPFAFASGDHVRVENNQLLSGW